MHQGQKDFRQYVQPTEGATGAEIKAIVMEAGMFAIRRDSFIVSAEDMSAARNPAAINPVSPGGTSSLIALGSAASWSRPGYKPLRSVPMSASVKAMGITASALTITDRFATESSLAHSTRE